MRYHQPYSFDVPSGCMSESTSSERIVYPRAFKHARSDQTGVGGGGRCSHRVWKTQRLSHPKRGKRRPSVVERTDWYEKEKDRAAVRRMHAYAEENCVSVESFERI